MTLDGSRCRGQIIFKTDAEIDSDLVTRAAEVRREALTGRARRRNESNPGDSRRPWELTAADAIEQYPAGATVSGDGDDVVLFTTGPRATDVAYQDPQGYNHFAVEVAMDGLVVPALPVNVTGSFSGPPADLRG